MKIFISGAAGFIGFHVTKAFLSRGDDVVGVDNLNDYYDPSLKEARLKELSKHNKKSGGEFTFFKGDISDGKFVKDHLKNGFDRAINLAAQAGVRRSLKEPQAYVKSNIKGFVNVLDDGEPSSHISIEGCISHAHFALVPRCQYYPTEFVTERH